MPGYQADGEWLSGQQMGGYREKAAKSIAWALLESVGLSGLSFVALIVFSRYLSPMEFGLGSVALVIIGLLNDPVERLFHDPIVQRKELSSLQIDSAFVASLVLGIGFSLACWFYGQQFTALLGQPQAGPVLQWMGLSLFAMGFGSVLIAQQRRNLEFRALALRSLIGRILGGVAGILLAIQGAGVWSLVAQQVLLVTLATCTLWLLSPYRPRFRFNWAVLKDPLRFGLPTTAYTIVAICSYNIFIILVGSFLGTEAAGYFGLAFRAVDMLAILVASAILQVALPLFSRLQNQEADMEKPFVSAMRLTTPIMFPLFAGLAATSQEVVEVVFGARWLVAAPYVALLALLTFPYFSQLFVDPLLKAIARPGLALIVMSVQAVFVISAMFLVGHRSLEWAAGVWAARQFCTVPLKMYMLKKAAGIRYSSQWRGAAKPGFAALLMGSGVFAAKLYFMSAWSAQIRLPAMVALGIVLYLSLLAILDRRLIMEVVDFGLAVVRRKRAASPEAPPEPVPLQEQPAGGDPE